MILAQDYRPSTANARRLPFRAEYNYATSKLRDSRLPYYVRWEMVRANAPRYVREMSRRARMTHVLSNAEKRRNFMQRNA